ncbi:MAG TPA: arsenite methyltransferase [Candidatus Nanopelagicales bacterium]|nr:arsenite methyltransferase [Candidatus Nanopelagicales bacterium]
MSTTAPDPTTSSDEQIRDAVRDRYAASARSILADLGTASCCRPIDTDAITRDLYDDAQSAEVPDAALAASLGCGNPTALALLEPGQVVLDLGSGGGIDVLLSARRVGPTGVAYGLDMTPEMLELARRNQAEAGVTNAEFLLGTIEDVPLDDASVDVIISNCVINLAADKDPVLREAHRVLRSGGRFAVSDMVLLRPLPDLAMRAMALWTGCISGALLDTDYRNRLGAAGFVDVELQVTRTLDAAELTDLAAQLPADALPSDADVPALIALMDGAIASAFIRATKP